MNSMDQQVIKQLSEWLQAGQKCWLCTIVSTFGSSPRPVGSLLACNENALYCGSLSGGCVEDDLRESIDQGVLARELPQRIEYGVAVEDVLRLGLPCGGRLEVVVEPIMPDQAGFYAELAQAIERRDLITRIVDLSTGAARLEKADQFEEFRIDGNTLFHTYGPSFRLLLVGAVQVAYYLSEMAQGLDYEVAICDPRPELSENFPKRDLELSGMMPDDWIRAKKPDRHTALVALCHDPRIDDMALMEALQHDFYYIGAMGSARTTEKRRERLAQLDIAAENIARLHAPVGLDIGSKTPPEIAIAILAELTQLRAQSRKDGRA